ncbi:ribbon-helix-helix protein, CopG family [Acidithiobacillus ferrooxidans]|uniref:ribbon-helix-helix domain-containing protein n=1 Tax=Acidithiobacillus TaxID=119977 RepID=UPI001C07DB0C|nr:MULTISPECIES: ribbon-helix-helix protein, CopG family [Acidithiobacillus]MBU2732721.1 ribbon-helix-helix protein, CopG family [Acidithiobacillus ferridurans]MCR2829071.1 ribbon-helix-helix protein, CopG family [Acidithiobacillus ferrooxidans]
MAVTAKRHSLVNEASRRASVTFPTGLYAELERIAEEKKVSVAWVVRDAVEKYVEAQYPLFCRQQ